MKNLLLVISLVIVFFSSCKKEESLPNPTPTNYQFKQNAFMWQNAWSNGDSSYSVFTYQIAVMGDQPMDEVKFILTVVLKDSTRLTLTENDLPNFGQVGYYSPAYQYPKYWIATIMDSKGVCIQQYGFTTNDVCRYEYEAKVRIGTTWYDVSKEGRKVENPPELFWI